MNKLRPAIKAKWLEALRSGKYKQSQRALRASGGYCCLGVLCDVYRKTKKTKGITWGPDMPSQKGLLRFYDGKGGSNFSSPTRNVWRWATGEDTISLMEADLIQMEADLIQMNDDDNKSFEAIANYIEKNL